MDEERIDLYGLIKRRPRPSPASPVSRHCAYLDNGFCEVCTCSKCAGGFLVEEWQERWKAGETGSGPRECGCVQRARTRKHLRDAGLEKQVQRCTLDSYRTDTPWRQMVRDMAEEYLQEGQGRSFFISGQSGCGKTHICVAMAGVLVEKGVRLRCFRWVEDGRRLKQLITEREEYERELRRWTEAEVLYIDDLLKQEVTDADIRLLYELLDRRYINDRPTLFSSERSLAWIRDARGGDGEAIAGRIFEMCGQGHFCLEIRGAEKNARFYTGTS